jgi:hypothetical protein
MKLVEPDVAYPSGAVPHSAKVHHVPTRRRSRSGPETARRATRRSAHRLTAGTLIHDVDLHFSYSHESCISGQDEVESNLAWYGGRNTRSIAFESELPFAWRDSEHGQSFMALGEGVIWNAVVSAAVGAAGQANAFHDWLS